MWGYIAHWLGAGLGPGPRSKMRFAPGPLAVYNAKDRARTRAHFSRNRAMNLITEIAEGIAKGWTNAKIALEVELKHGVQVGEAWIARITGCSQAAGIK